MAIRTVRVLGRAVVAIALLAVLATIVLWSWQRHVMQAPGPHDSDSFLVIEPGDGHATIRWEMKRAGLIKHLYHYDMAQLTKRKRRKKGIFSEFKTQITIFLSTC